MTTNTDTPFGLRPVGYRDGSPYNGAVNPYYVNASYGTALFVGDAVIKVAGGSNAAAVGNFPIGTLPEIEKATAGDGNQITGVIVGFAPLPTNLGLTYNTASTERVAYVCDDPNVLFEIQADGAIAAAQVGLNAVLIYTNAGSTVTGRSGAELDTSSDVPAADASNQLTILRVVNRPDNYAATNFTKVLVAINAHTELTGSIGI
jgi:hypothetical protein